MNRALKWVTIMDLRLPGDWKARLASEGARSIADSGEILSPPAIRKADSSVIFGADRLAAMHIRGAQQAECWVIDCTEDEVPDLRDTENAFRRNPDLVARARLVSRRAAAIQAQADAPGNSLSSVSEIEPPKRGRPPTAEGKARAEMAAKLGVTKNALEVQAHREKAEQRAEVGAQPASPGVLVAPPLPAGTDAAAPPPGADIAEKLDAIDKLLVQATGLVTKLAKEHPELVERFPLQATKFALQREVAPAFRGMSPHWTCAYCKLWPSELPNCGACKGSGWLTKDQCQDIPWDLTVDGEGAGIYVEGKFVTLLQLAAAAKRKAAKAPKRATVVLVDEHGGEEPWTDAWVEEP